jgi:hypothetical protein
MQTCSKPKEVKFMLDGRPETFTGTLIVCKSNIESLPPVKD